MRKIGSVRRKIAPVSIAHTLLEFDFVNAKPGTEVAEAGNCLDMMGSRCRITYMEILTSFIGLVLRLGGEGARCKGDSSNGAAVVSEAGNRIRRSLEGWRHDRDVQARDRRSRLTNVSRLGAY